MWQITPSCNSFINDGRNNEMRIMAYFWMNFNYCFSVIQPSIDAVFFSCFLLIVETIEINCFSHKPAVVVSLVALKTRKIKKERFSFEIKLIPYSRFHQPQKFSQIIYQPASALYYNTTLDVVIEKCLNVFCCSFESWIVHESINITIEVKQPQLSGAC